MNDERPPLEPIDDEELRSAAALARALEGGGADPVLSGAELETANGIVHLLLALGASGYFPGLATAPLLHGPGTWLAFRLARS